MKRKKKTFVAWAVMYKKNVWSGNDYPVPVAACTFTPKGEDEDVKLSPCAIFVYKSDAERCKKLAIKNGAPRKLTIGKVVVSL
jgi:hypothetical protein